MTAPLTGASRAAALEDIHRRRVLHEAGHAVAAVACGGRITAFSVPFDDFSGEPPKSPQVSHTARPADRPFVTWAGLYASALALVETGEYDNAMDALDAVVGDYDAGDDGDTAKLADAGIDPVRPPEGWTERMDALWPAVKAATDILLVTGCTDMQYHVPYPSTGLNTVSYDG